MGYTFIYGLIDPRTNEVKYVGKSNYPKKRLSEHISRSKSSSKRTKKETWINKLLKLKMKPILDIIKEVPIDEYEKWETFYIKKYKDEGCDLVNWDDDGKGMVRHHNKLQDESVKSTSRGVKQYNLDGILVGEFKSMREASRVLNVSHGNISRVCNKIWEHTNGFIFRYINDINEIKPIKNGNAIKKIVLLVDINGGIISEFNSITEASKQTGVDASGISRVCNGKLNKIKNKFFKFK